MTVRFTAGRLTLLCGVALTIASTGCVRRTVTINSDPQGARVLLNDEEVGTSPVRVDFTWYGDYDVILRKDGYETLQTHYRLNPPWYQVFPIDFVAEVLVPVTIHDHQAMSFTLEPAKPIDQDQLRKEAAEFRERTLFGQK